MVTHIASVKVHRCVKRTRSKTTGYKSKTPQVRLRFMFHYCIPPNRPPTCPARNAANVKELISSRRELNSFLSGMEYRSHSGAKRRLPPAPAARTTAHVPHAARPCVFNKLTPQQPEPAESRLTALFSAVAIEQPVNASIFAFIGCRPLISQWLLYSNLKLLVSTRSGVVCPA